MTVVYDQAFFDLIRPGVQRSAATFVPWLLDTFASVGFLPRTMIDVGCGEGWWTREFYDQNLYVVGVDGAGGGAAIPGGGKAVSAMGCFVEADLAEPWFDLGKGYDLALSLEVAEHLSPERAAGFVDDLCRLAPVVVFSAAIPGQGGHGHLNEQWPGYWADLFAAQGYDVTGDLRYGIWDDDRIEHWYRQNLMVAWAPGALDFEPSKPLALVHPKLWEHYR